MGLAGGYDVMTLGNVGWDTDEMEMDFDQTRYRMLDRSGPTLPKQLCLLLHQRTRTVHLHTPMTHLSSSSFKHAPDRSNEETRPSSRTYK